MDIHSLACTPSENLIAREAAPLIRAVGTADFEEQIFRVVHAALKCEHVNAFGICDGMRPRMIFAASATREPVARRAGEIYRSQFWSLDPANQLMAQRDMINKCMLIRLSSQEMKASPYRRDCYTSEAWAESGAHLIERVSIAKRTQSELIRIGFYRHKRLGSFQQSDFDIIQGVSELLFALAKRHNPILINPSDKVETRQDFAFCLRAIAPDLTPRETDVCAGIAAGLTSEAIALALGIKLNTVLTHRKRAYARLNISSEKELLRLIYRALVSSAMARV
jgi:LuxR family transcriptional regulator, activator of tox operons